MKTSELIKKMQESLEKNGDMEIEIRDKENGESYFDIFAFADPASDMEDEEGISGTFTIEFCEEQ